MSRVRVTACYRKIDDKWMVAHEHISVPFYMDGTGRAAVDLKPEQFHRWHTLEVATL
jgi:hypothetical protein